jgi:hypothetical protein
MDKHYEMLSNDYEREQNALQDKMLLLDDEKKYRSRKTNPKTLIGLSIR